jgi:hypothetical protein
MILEYLKSNIFELIILTIVFLNYFIFSCSNKSLFLIILICLTKAYFQGLTSERDVLYLFIIVYASAVTFYSEVVPAKKVSFSQNTSKAMFALVLVSIVFVSMYLESKYRISVVLLTRIPYNSLLFSVVFIPIAIIIRKVKR